MNLDVFLKCDPIGPVYAGECSTYDVPAQIAIADVVVAVKVIIE